MFNSLCGCFENLGASDPGDISSSHDGQAPMPWIYRCRMAGAGHLFVIDGDLTKVHCDALLVPTDADRTIEEHWHSLFPGGTRYPGRRFAPGERVQRLGTTDAPAAGPDIWLGQFGHRKGDTEDWYADGLVDFVEQASAAYKAVNGVPRRIAVNVVGSGKGGARLDKGTLLKTIVPRLAEAAAAKRIDVVLVCHGRRQYEAAQRVRRELAGTQPAWLTNKIADLADHARHGNLVLFVGAGVSMGAGLGSWSELIQGLAVEGSQHKPLDSERLLGLDVRDQAAILANRLGEERYRQAVVEQVGSISRYALGHGLLASLGATEHVTTNYDTLFETALGGPEKCSVLPYAPVSNDKPWLLKLHGSVDRPDDIVLTRSEYLGLHERAGALFGILQAMLMTRHMLFVGYSLTDDSFHKVMHEVRRARSNTTTDDKVGTALLLNGDPLLEEMWELDLDFASMSQDPLSKQPSRAKKELARRARELDVFLDRVCLLASDVSSFLLDETYDKMLTPQERSLRTAVRRALDEADAADGPTAEHVAIMLRSLGGSPP